MTKIKELSLHYDRISTKFVAGDLKWIDDLFVRHQIEQFSVSKFVCLETLSKRVYVQFSMSFENF